MKQRLISILIALSLVFSVSSPAWADELEQEQAGGGQEQAYLPVSEDEGSPVPAYGEVPLVSKEQIAAIDPSGVAVDEAAAGQDYVADEIIVVLDPDKPKEEVEGSLAEGGLSVKQEITTKESEGFASAVVGTPEGKSVSQTVDELKGQDGVVVAQPNYIYTTMDVPNDPALKSPDTNWHLSSVKAFDAWEIAKTSRSVKVAVIDSGVKTTHEDLKNNLDLANAYNAISYEKGAGKVADESGHGTHVSGIIAAQANNGIGTAGLSYNAEVVPVKALEGPTGKGTSRTLAAGIEYAIELAQVRVINISAGSQAAADPVLKLWCDAANARGITVVCAAGNWNSTKTVYPSDFESCVGVINLTDKDTRYSGTQGSSYGLAKDISAPGVNIYSTGFSSQDPYVMKTGTSMSAPVVSGIAALLYSIDPYASSTQVKAALFTTATHLGPGTGKNAEYGYGKVNAEAAAQSLKASAPATRAITQATVGKIEAVSYTGKARTPKPTLTLNGHELVQGADYTVSYSDNVESGTAKMTITGKGRFAGSIAKSFAISPATLKVTTESASKVYDGKPLTAKGSLSGLVNGETATVATTGSQTAVGQSKNSYTLSWGSAKKANYKVAESLGTLTVTKLPFSDVKPDDWYVKDGYLGYSLDHGLMTGYSGTSLFGPYDDITRGQLAMILWRMAGTPTARSADFEDVNYSLYYGNAIRWARNTGVITGFEEPDGSYRFFRPDDPATREQVALMLANYASQIGGKKVSSDGNALNKISGAAGVSPWARSAMGWAVDKGILTGDLSSGTAKVNPQDKAWRCAVMKMAVMLHRDVL